MKKILILLLLIFTLFLSASSIKQIDDSTFDIENLYHYQKEYKSEEITTCSSNRTKTYMDYRATTVKSSKQYKFIHNELTVDKNSGFLYDKDGFIGAALGSFYGVIGDRFYFTLETGIVLPIVKCEEKADHDTDSTGCYHLSDGSVIEFVIDKNYANNYFGHYPNGLVLQGNYANYDLFKGKIVKVEKVLEEKNDKYITYSKLQRINDLFENIFEYGQGY